MLKRIVSHRHRVKPILTWKNCRRGAVFLGLVFTFDKSKRFYDDYAKKKEGLRRLKKRFLNPEQSKPHGIPFVDFFHEDYRLPMIELIPESIDEVRILLTQRFIKSSSTVRNLR